MIHNFKTISVFFIITLFFACSGSSEKKNSTEAQEESAASSPASPAEVANKEGQELFLKYCMACHQTDGSGVPGMYPPIVNSPIVNSGKKEDFIKILLNGLKGPIEVHGKKYNQQMPKQDFLTDEQLALIINFVSTSFQNKAPEVTPADVKQLRDAASK